MLLQSILTDTEAYSDFIWPIVRTFLEKLVIEYKQKLSM